MRRWLVLVVLVAACGSSGHKLVGSTVTTSPTGASMSQLRQQYLDAVAPVNKMSDDFRDIMTKLPADASTSDVAAFTAPLVSAFHDLDEQLLRLDWPTSMKQDANGLVVADRGMESTLDQVGHLTAFDLTTWSNQLGQDFGKVSASVAIMRADLGLPPA